MLLDQVNDLFGSTAAAVVVAVIGRCTVLRCWVPLNDREPPAWIPKRSGYRERERGCCCERPYLKAIYVAEVPGIL